MRERGQEEHEEDARGGTDDEGRTTPRKGRVEDLNVNGGAADRRERFEDSSAAGQGSQQSRAETHSGNALA